VLVTPGVRSAERARAIRSAWPRRRKRSLAAADYLVIGRQITRAPDPAAEARRILAEIQR